MGSVFGKGENENEASELTLDTNPEILNKDNTSIAIQNESNNEITIETEEKHESHKEKVNEQNNQQKSTNDLKKQEANDEVSELTKELENVQLQKQSPVVIPKIEVEDSQQKTRPRGRNRRFCMQIAATNKTTGVTNSIYGTELSEQRNQQMYGNNNQYTGNTCIDNRPSQPHLQHFQQNTFGFPAKNANNDNKSPEEPGKHICKRSRESCPCLCEHQPDNLTDCTCPCCPKNSSDTQNVWNLYENVEIAQVLSEDVASFPNHQDNIYYQTPESSFSDTNSGQQNSLENQSQQLISPQEVPQLNVETNQYYYQPQYNQELSGFRNLGPSTDPGSLTSQSINYEHLNRSFSYTPHLSTHVPTSQQKYFPQMEYFPHHNQQYFPHHNQAWIGTGPNTGYANETDQLNVHNIAPNEVPAFPQQFRGRSKGRPRSSNHPATIYMRDYNANRTKYATLGQGIIQRFNEFPPEARHIIEELMATAGIDNPISSQRRF